jgi:hypothetical protein
MTTPKYRVSNQVRDSVVSFGATVVDTTTESFRAMIQDLASNDSGGLWLKPYRGIPDVPGLHPFDLILLSDEAQVLDVAAPYPTVKLADLETPVASALVLPLRTIRSSLTSVGDQLVISEADERDAVVTTLPVKKSQQPEKTQALGNPEEQEKPGLFIRILRWFWPKSDSGRAPRQTIPNLGAYHWTGGAPQIFALGDISATGFYLITAERWTPGTIALMTLQRTNTSGIDPRDAISVVVQAVRWGLDGMGFEFIMDDFVEANPGLILAGKGTDREALEQFLMRLKLQN